MMNDGYFVSEPELKWCERIINDPENRSTLNPPPDWFLKNLLMAETNLCEIRIVRAINMLRRQRRIYR